MNKYIIDELESASISFRVNPGLMQVTKVHVDVDRATRSWGCGVASEEKRGGWWMVFVNMYNDFDRIDSWGIQSATRGQVLRVKSALLVPF